MLGRSQHGPFVIGPRGALLWRLFSHEPHHGMLELDGTGAKPRITYAMLFRFLVVKDHPGLQQVSIRNTFGDTIVFSYKRIRRWTARDSMSLEPLFCPSFVPEVSRDIEWRDI